MPRLISIIAGLCLLARLAESASAEISVSTDFEGGSAKVIAIDKAAKIVRISPAGDPARGWPCWWYLRVNGVPKGEKLMLEIVPSEQLLVGPSKNRGKPLSPGWSQPQRATISTDGKHWQHSEPGRAEGG